MAAEPHLLPPVCGTRIERARDDERASTWIVSDLHLGEEDAPVWQRFERLLARVAAEGAAARLWILGDLFDAWVGKKQLASASGRRAVAALRATTGAGVAVSVLHGNRDFLLDGHFAAATGVRVVPGGLEGRFGARRVLALHGDELCRRDLPYQRAKRVLRHPVTKALVRALPFAFATRLSGRARQRSTMVIASGDQTRFDPTADALREVARAGYEVLVFGHIHRPARGVFEAGLEYCILPAFDAGGVGLRATAGELRAIDAEGQLAGEAAPRAFA